MMQAWGVTLLRLTVGVVFVAHGVPKLFGPMWGTSPEGTVALFALVGLQPAPLLAVTVGIVELCGGMALFLGAFTRLMSALLAIIMAVAIWKVHWPYGFFLNLSLEPGVGHGFEHPTGLVDDLGGDKGHRAAGPGSDGGRLQLAQAKVDELDLEGARDSIVLVM